uniref:Uncharacterized protein n=1 Tax=Setaria viridis TaxID=4556 RepID=A0A4U6W346_SETVI|nr:hypothetical protein SEVIR_2G342232v2 [Setaria viridis]
MHEQGCPARGHWTSLSASQAAFGWLWPMARSRELSWKRRGFFPSKTSNKCC